MRCRAWVIGLGIALIVVPTESVGARRAHTGALLNIDSFSIDFDSQVDYQGARVSREFLSSNSSSRTVTTGLRFGSGGSVYHPKVLSFQGSVRLAISRLDRTGSGANIDRNGSFDEYDFTARLFSEASLSGFFTARRDRERQRSRGLGDQDFTRDLQRLQLNFRNRVMPIQARWSWEDFVTEGVFETVETRRNFGLEGARNYDFGLTRITYSNEDYVSRSTGITTKTARLDVQQNFTMGTTAQLSNALYWLDQDILGRRTNRRASSNLRLFLPANLTSTTRGSFFRIGELDGTTDRLEGEASLDHSLYESLDSRIWAYIFREDNPDGRVDRRDLQTTIDYRKRVPFGRLRYGFSWKDVRQNNRVTFAELSVFDASFVFPIDNRISLPDLNIIPESVVVLDQTGLIPYTETLDYEIEIVGRQVNILRVLTGAIQRDATVLVSYRYRVDGGGSGGYRDLQHRVGLDLPAGFTADYAVGETTPRYVSGVEQEGIFSGDVQNWDLRWQWGVFDTQYRNIDQVVNGLRDERESTTGTLRARTASGIAFVTRGSVGWTRYDNGPRLEFRDLMITVMRDRGRTLLLSGDAFLAWEELDTGDRSTAELRLRADLRYGPNQLKTLIRYVRSDAESLGLQEDTGITIEFERKIR